MKLLIFAFIPIASFAQDALDLAFDRMYRHNFPGALQAIASHTSTHPDDPLGHAVRASAYLFQELARLSILESEFFSDDKRISGDKKEKPDLALKAALFGSIDKARELGTKALAQNPKDKNALFALAIAGGIQTDYLALVEKKQLRSLTFARESHSWAVKLLNIDPNYYDAYLTTGLSEYLLGSMPFFVRWFVKFDQAEGSKSIAVRNLELTARNGRYLSPFAKVLLAIVNLREKRPAEAQRFLAELSAKYPENPLFRNELQKLAHRTQPGAAGGVP